MYSPYNETVSLTRDCDAVVIPAGDSMRLSAGTEGAITQALGGSFTIYVDGNLYRIAGIDADALGKEPVELPKLPPDATDGDVETLVWDQMKTVFDPEIPVNIVDLGLIYKCEIEKCEDGTRNVDITMTLTAPGCGMGDILVEDVRSKVELVPTIEQANVELVFEPMWHYDMMSEAARLETGMY